MTPNEKTQLLSYQEVAVKHCIDADDDKFEILSGKRELGGQISSPLLFILILGSTLYYVYCMMIVVPQHHHDHTIPTLLSVQSSDVEAKTKGGSRYVNSLSNPLYDIMKRAKFDPDSLSKKQTVNKDLELYSLYTDKDIVSFHDNFTISWKLNYNDDTNVTENAIDNDGNVIALYCPATETDPKKFRDAATISQIKTTNAYNMKTKKNHDFSGLLRRVQQTVFDSNKNKWFIPSFPIIRESTCELRYWVRGRNEYHSDSKGYAVAKFTLGGTKQFNIENGLSQPTTIHLAFTTDSSQMSVQFSTGVEGTPVVVYSQDADIVISGYLNMGLQVAMGTSTTYVASDMCQEPATREEPGKFTSPGFLHAVTMENLIPNSKYFYKVGILSKNENMNDVMDIINWSEVYSFQSPILSQDTPNTTQPFSYIIYADQGAMGYGNDDGGERTSAWAKREIETHNIRAVHHIGDLSYAQGAGHMWDKWLDMVSVFSTRVPLMIGIGNHEYDHTGGGENGKDPSGITSGSGFMPNWGDFATDSSGECGVPVAKRFTVPNNGNGVFWYSFNTGNIHSIIISSEHDLSPKSEQYMWLEADLAAVDRTLTPWVIVESHRPMYNIEDIPTNTNVGIGMRNEFEHLLSRYHVDFLISGHYHSYMRSCSGLYESKCNNGGPIHITVGTAGAELDRVPLLTVDWMDKFIVQWGYGRITSLSDNQILWEFVSDKDDKVMDQILVQK